MAKPKLKLTRFSPPPRSRKALWLGCAAGLLSRLRIRHASPITSSDLRRQDYPTSTQRMGIHFTDRLRDTFRFRWLGRTR